MLINKILIGQKTTLYLLWYIVLVSFEFYLLLKMFKVALYSITISMFLYYLRQF